MCGRCPSPRCLPRAARASLGFGSALRKVTGVVLGSCGAAERDSAGGQHASRFRHGSQLACGIKGRGIVIRGKLLSSSAPDRTFLRLFLDVHPSAP